MTSQIAIIGAGFAGLTAGVCLAALGYPVTVYETARTLGGRARAIEYQGHVLDNGQHICLGAYTHLLALLQQMGLKEEALFLRLPLHLTLLPHFHFTLPALPAPWHLLGGLLQAQGFTLAERWQLVKLIQAIKRCRDPLAPDQTVASWLRHYKQSQRLIAWFWSPLCLAALNTPIEIASAQLFIYVLRDSLFSPHHSDLLLPRVDLSHVFPNAAAQFIQQHQGNIHTGTRVHAIEPYQHQWQVNGKNYDHVIIAVAPHQLAQLTLPHPLTTTASLLAQWAYQAIATVYLQYPAHIMLPHPMQGIAEGVSQWVFDRGQTHQQPGLIAIVISSINTPIDHKSLVQQIEQEMVQFFHIEERPLWHKVIIEKRATFSAEVNLDRPKQKTGLKGVWLAGDYTSARYPATIEGAVISGKKISQFITEQHHE